MLSQVVHEKSFITSGPGLSVSANASCTLHVISVYYIPINDTSFNCLFSGHLI